MNIADIEIFTRKEKDPAGEGKTSWAKGGQDDQNAMSENLNLAKILLQILFFVNVLIKKKALIRGGPNQGTNIAGTA